MDASITRSGEGRSLSLYDVRFDYGPDGSDTDGRLALIEVTIPPRTLVKPHEHSREDEYTLILDGTVGVRIGDRTEETVPAGSYLVKPRDIPHALWNVADEPARVLEIISPAGFETYFDEVAPILREHGPEWTERFYEVAARYGIVVLDDWSDELKARYGITL